MGEVLGDVESRSEKFAAKPPYMFEVICYCLERSLVHTTAVALPFPLL